MTDPVLPSLMVAGAVATAGSLALIDPSITSIALAAIAVIGVVIPLWFKFKTDKMQADTQALIAKSREHDVRLTEVIKTSDGMKDELVKMTEKAGIAKGREQATLEAEGKAAAKAEGVAEGVAKEKASEKDRQMTPPK